MPQASPFFFAQNINSKRVISASVREVVHFVLRSGGLAGSGRFSGGNRALEGTRGHVRLQKSRPAGFEAEVAVAREIETPQFTFKLKGRIDGVLASNGTLLIEEIKTVSHLDDLLADPLHWGQAKIYAFLYASEHGFREVEVQITYLELESFRTKEFREQHSLDDLKAFFESVVGEYIEWLQEHANWLRIRNESIAEVRFPFDEYRAGQRSLAVAAYRAIKARSKLFAEAPTGIGKTISVLFPAIKALGEGHVEKIFYTTAKTIGRAVAEKAISDLREKGLRIRSVTLTARDKVCFSSGQPCDLAACPYAVGYYDRIKKALKDGLKRDAFARADIEALAREHQVCPFELSLDLAVWSDGIICDLNYVFDPAVSLKRFFSEDRQEFAILVDEAHNLVDRAREMFSAELDHEKITHVRKLIADELPECARALGKVVAQFTAFKKGEGCVERDGAFVRKEPPVKLPKILRDFLAEAERWLAQNKPSALKEPLLELYFDAAAFVRTLEFYNDRYVTYREPERGRLKLFCIDPSQLIGEVIESVGSAIFFSATLNPIDYYRESLGGELTDAILQLPSPFPPENLAVLVQDRIATRLRSRNQSVEEVARSIHAMVSGRIGNYLVYFSSYEYMAMVYECFRTLFGESETAVQKTGMSEPEREQFLARFQTEGARTFVAFAVLGGIFGEGIDLVGERLIGVTIVGVGLPQICLERDLIRDYWQQKGRAGFDYAYTFPGMNRVLQAVGRLIRSENDLGIALLVDERFGWRLHRELFPPWWLPEAKRTPAQIGERVEEFWARSKPTASIRPEYCRP